MPKRFIIPGIAAALAMLTACDLNDLCDFHGSERYTQDFHHSYPLKPGGRVTVENVNGAIEVSAWDDNSVQIDGTKYGPTPELRDAIKIDINAQPDTIHIRTIRPSDRRGNMGARYTIKVPRQTQLERVTSTNGAIRAGGMTGDARLQTTNGSIRTEGIRGALEAQTTNGGIEVRAHEGGAQLRTTNGRIRADGIRGALEAFTTNGGIGAEISEAQGTRPIRLETSNGGIELTLDHPGKGDVRASTSNGGITVRLPDSVNARLIAATSHAAINCDFDVREGTREKNRVEGVIGSGGPTYELSTSNGGIRIIRR